MKKRFALDPRNIFIALDEIDQQKPSYTLNRHDTLRRVFWTLACVCISLLTIHYLKFFSSFQAFLYLLAEWQDKPRNYWSSQLQRSDYMQLASYSWWTFWHLIGYIAIPFLIIRYKLKTSFTQMGWRFNETAKHWKGYLLLLSPILLFVLLVSFRTDFVQHYPFYKQAGRSWFDFIAWEALYLTQFICLEFFFRGFIIQSLRPAIGANAIWVMCVPYLMIHLPKLWLEASGAILFGLFLGILALRSRSIWGGFFVHAGVAVSMDIASLLQQGKIPSQLWP
ncbi:CPBP family intramembrane glutamic endopeptidase [Teredinibacter haidensis]|uniref:CPBP family intramembrane glutamic endopeptidase n=1 Tax=Teredinibacter haidensis TaxID=2731755 RepID=UPI0009490419|nr:CPBP family intramembrane glutamic endopeptidase [Teredinibacter haidensis]